MPNGDINMDAYFKLEKCEIGLFNWRMKEFYENLKIIIDAARIIDQN